MGARFLTELAEVCRGAGLEVVEVDGWPSRARGSGGYDGGKPDHVMAHHTASGPSSDGWPDVNYLATGHPDAPVSNLYLDRQGVVYVIAAGASNTNGTGDCAHLPADTMNSSAIGIEAGNDGVGEPWPAEQTTAYVVLVDALCAAYGIAVDHVHGHAEWAPARKIDPAGPSPWADAGTWPMDAFRADLGGSVPPPDPNGDDEMTQDQANELHAAYMNSAWTWELVQQLAARVEVLEGRWTQDVANEAHGTFVKVQQL